MECAHAELQEDFAVCVICTAGQRAGDGENRLGDLERGLGGRLVDEV